MAKKAVKMNRGLKPHVLIADDNIELRKELQRLFRSRGFRVTCTGSVDGSISGLSAKHFDIIILDMRMPEKEGGEIQHDAGLVVAYIMRSFSLVRHDVVVVVFTAFPSVKDCFAAIRAGAYYLPKAVPGKRNMSEELVRECERLTEERGRQQEDKPTWLTEHFTELARKFGGRTIAIVDCETARRERLRGGTQVGECLVFAAASLEDLRSKVLRNSRFRRSMPVVIEVPKEV